MSLFVTQPRTRTGCPHIQHDGGCDMSAWMSALTLRLNSVTVMVAPE
jgi:hypothetical protein